MLRNAFRPIFRSFLYATSFICMLRHLRPLQFFTLSTALNSTHSYHAVMTYRFRNHYDRGNLDVQHDFAPAYDDHDQYHPNSRLYDHEESRSTHRGKHDFNRKSYKFNKPLYQHPPADWARQHQWDRSHPRRFPDNTPYHGHNQHGNDKQPQNDLWNSNVEHYNPPSHYNRDQQNGDHEVARSNYSGSSANARYTQHPVNFDRTTHLTHYGRETVPGHTQRHVVPEQGTHSHSKPNFKASDPRRNLKTGLAMCSRTSSPNRNDETIKHREKTIVPKGNPRNTKLLKCLMCSHEVIPRRFREHLLFGSVQCQSCPWQTRDCKVFSERHNYVYNCTHTSLKWSFVEVDEHIPNDNERRIFLKAYLGATVALKHYSPFQNAYQHFEQYMKNSCSAVGENIVKEQQECVTTAQDSTKLDVSEVREQRRSNDSNESQKENLEDLVTFEQSCSSRVIRDPRCTPLRRTKTAIRMRKLVVAKGNDKHQTLMIGSSKTEADRVPSSKETPVDKARRNVQKTLSLLPSFIRAKNYVVTCVLRDYCPQCYSNINPEKLIIFLNSSLMVAQCGECSLYVCYRDKPQH